MGQISKIQWTDATWNPARGCEKVSEECKFCYMMRDAKKYGWDGEKVQRTKTVFNLPLKIKEPSKIFTSSLTDIFHPDIDSFRNEIWDIIRKCPHHIFQILTKRPERIKQSLPQDWGLHGWSNVWFGVSIGNDRNKHRMATLQSLKTINSKFLTFISAEPLIGHLDLYNDAVVDMEHFENVDWLIIGGESGNDTGYYRYRPCEIQWIESLVEQAVEAEVAVFVKQLGTYLSKELGLKDRHGGNMDEFPLHLRIREFPTHKN